MREGSGATTADARERLVVTVLLAVPVVVISACFWPGHMNADTLSQLQQVATGDYNNQHDPLLLAIWHPLWRIGVGPGWSLAAQVAAVVGGAYLVLRAMLTPLVAALATVLIALSPPVFGLLGLIGRDVWFTGALLIAFGAAARVSSSKGSRRVAWVVVALAALWVTLAARQNAVFATIVAAVALVAAAPRPLSASALRRRTVRTGYLIGMGLVLTLVLVGSQRVASAAVHVQNVHPAQYTYIYDVGALSETEHRNLFPSDVLPARGMTSIDRYWYVDTVTTMLYVNGSPIHAPLPSEAEGDLFGAWRHALVHHPFAYLGERGRLWLRQASITRRARWIYHPQIDPNTLGLATRFRSLDRAAGDYVEAFTSDDQLDGSIVHAVVIYLALALVGPVALLRGSRTTATAIAGSAFLASLTYQVGLFFGATGVQYRFELPTVVIGLLAVCFLLARLSRLISERRQRATATA